ncbi:MAG: hypothetical protein Q7U04_08280 [Bacteriovorax sp.]|nr:hypothetical protein [Bacteriovorax sp.]
MKKLTRFFENKRSIAGLFLLAALVGNTYNIQENSVRIKRLTNFESGMQTCFGRVNQTYTAKILADTASNYLTQNFQNLTEECFAEGILNVEDSFKSELSQVAKKLSTLASNVHWFHEDILSPGPARAITNNGESRDVGVRFEKIESTKDEILESSEKYKTEITNSLNNEKSVFYISATLLVVLMLSEFMSNTRRRLTNNGREKEARAELVDNGGVTSVKVGEIIRSALEQNNLVNCSKLFANYYAYQSFDKSIKNKNKFSLEGLIAPIGEQNPIIINKTIDKIWNDDSIGLTADTFERKMLQDLNLENMTSAIIDLLAEKLFSQGVQLDVKISENLNIKGRSEELEQILYHLINFAINSTQSDLNEKNISIYAHRLGDIVALDLIYSGVGVDEEILKQRIGIGSSPKSLDVDLQICQTLIEEIDAKLQLDNKLNQNGDIVGGRVKIIFKAGANDQARLVDLKIGSKKEILATINQSVIN